MPDPLLDSTLFRHVVGHFGSGVTVVTSRDAVGAPVGFTASSVTSLSLDPLLVAVGVATEGETLAAIRASGAFGINVLARTQEHLALRFAGVDRADRFRDLSVTMGATGCPRFDACLAWMDCALHAEYPAGDHALIVGRVEACDAGAGEPLLYYRGRFGGWTQ